MSRVSYTQLSMWSKCPWRWKLNYIDGHSVFTESIYTLFGTSMHETVQTYLTVFYNDTIKAADSLQLDKMLQYRMMENFKKAKEEIGEDCCTKEEMSEFYLQGVIILELLILKLILIVLVWQCQLQLLFWHVELVKEQ